jgi:ComF family protein
VRLIRDHFSHQVMGSNPSKLIRFFNDALGLFLPDLCLFCDHRLQNGDLYVCSECWRSLPLCPDRDGTPFRPLRGVLNRLWIGWIYGDRMRRIVHLLKYDGRPELAERLILEWTKILPVMKIASQMDVIIPVPIHTARRRHRGFNQSELLAAELSKRLGVPAVLDGVHRTVNTPSQTNLDKTGRWKSVTDIFSVTDTWKIAEKKVLIVDDLVTSGATLHSLAHRLSTCGASEVNAAVLTTPFYEGRST